MVFAQVLESCLDEISDPRIIPLATVRLAGSYRCWFVKKYCWLVCVREKYCSGWKFTIVYDKPQPNEQAVVLHIGGGNGPVGESSFFLTESSFSICVQALSKDVRKKTPQMVGRN